MEVLEKKKIKAEILNLSLKNMILIGAIGANMGGLVVWLILKG